MQRTSGRESQTSLLGENVRPVFIPVMNPDHTKPCHGLVPKYTGGGYFLLGTQGVTSECDSVEQRVYCRHNNALRPAKPEFLTVTQDGKPLLEYLKWSTVIDHLGGKPGLSGDGARWKCPLPLPTHPRFHEGW